MTKEKNTLYFEGAGWNFYSEEQNNQSDVGNFRIRTSFFDNDGVQYYVEVGNGHRVKKSNKDEDSYFLHVDYFFNVADQLDSPNKKVCKKFDINYLRTLDYTKTNILKLINENLNCNFEEMEVLDRFYDYHVHDGKGLYNAMEYIELNHERAKARKSAYEKVDMEYRKALNEKHRVINIENMNDNEITIKCHSSESKLKSAKLKRLLTIPVNYKTEKVGN